MTRAHRFMRAQRNAEHNAPRSQGSDTASSPIVLIGTIYKLDFGNPVDPGLILFVKIHATERLMTKLSLLFLTLCTLAAAQPASGPR